MSGSDNNPLWASICSLHLLNRCFFLHMIGLPRHFLGEGVKVKTGQPSVLRQNGK